MVITKESQVKKEIRKILDRYPNDIHYFMPSMNGYGKSGVSDFICCVKGRFLAIEAKVSKNNATDNQKLFIQNINRTAGVAVIVNETLLPQLDRAINQLLKTGIDNESNNNTGNRK